MVVKCGENRKKTCNKCNELKEINYMNDSFCKKCRSDINKEKRRLKRIEQGKMPYGLGRNPNCSKCGELKDEQYLSSGYCRKCCSERKKEKAAKLRREKGLNPLGYGRKDTCCKCGKIKENKKMGYCYDCHRKKDRQWRVQTGRSLKNRTGKCQCGKPFASYSNCYCVECASEWRRNYLNSNPEVKKKIFSRSNERRRKNPEEMIKHYSRCITNNAIKRGELIRQPCEICHTKENIEAHHDDYTQPLNVRWLCKRHHAEHHKQLKDKDI